LGKAYTYLRMQSRAIQSVARTRGMRWDWQKLVTPRTPKAAVAQYQARAQELISKRQEARAVPKEIPAIDWAFWEKQIAAPGVVAGIRKEYEGLKFDPPVLDSAVKAVLDETQNAIVRAVGEARLAAFELQESDKVIEKLEKVKSEGSVYQTDQWIETLPFMEEQIEQDREDLDWVPDDGERELLDIDMKAIKESVKAGLRPKLVPDTTDLKLGHYDHAEEERLKKEGRWSIARSFATREERKKITEHVDKLLAAKD